ncbi:hypothetical protein V6N13_039883 [Hibiscus sabdariffa]
MRLDRSGPGWCRRAPEWLGVGWPHPGWIGVAQGGAIGLLGGFVWAGRTLVWADGTLVCAGLGYWCAVRDNMFKLLKVYDGCIVA